MSTAYQSDFLTQTIGSYIKLFESLPCPQAEQVNDCFLAEFIGPGWLRWLAPKLLPLGGLSGWEGKSLRAEKAINLLRREGQLIEAIPMVRNESKSVLAEGDVLCLSYDKRAPVPLRALRDELRMLDDDTLLGLTVIDIPLLRKFPMPFLLKRQ